MEDPAPEPEEEKDSVSTLMERVKAAQDAKDMDALRRFRHCFHEAAHAFVGHHYDEETDSIQIDVPAGERPRASMGKKNLKVVDSLARSGKKGTPEILEPLTRLVAYFAAGELFDIEVDPSRKPISARMDNDVWELHLPKQETDRDSIIVFMRAAGFKYRTDVIQEGERRAKEIVANRRESYESLVTRLFDHGNIGHDELQTFLDA